MTWVPGIWWQVCSCVFHQWLQKTQPYSPHAPSPVTVMRPRDTGHSSSWDLFFSAVACENKKYSCLYRGLWKWLRWDLIHSVPKELLVKWSGIDFWKIKFNSVIDKTFLNLFGEHPLPPNLLASNTTCYVLTCVYTGGTEWFGRNRSEPWNTMITYFISG